MKNLWKKMTAMVMTTAMVFAMTAGMAVAQPVEEELLTGSKTSQLIEADGDKYEVTVEVPGKAGKHDEIILLVDGSYSTDEEWPATRAAILEIAGDVLDGSGDVQMTLMTFGMGDNIVVEKMKSVEQMDAALTELPGGLLYGRSSTNCEAGFNGIGRYLDANAGKINSANVIYITDGNINTDETPRDFSNWRYYSTKQGVVGTAQLALKDCLIYALELPKAVQEHIVGSISEEHMQERIELSTMSEANAWFNEVKVGFTEEQLCNWMDAIYEEVYDYSGLTLGTEYPISVVERAFVKYDKEHETYAQDAFYYATYKSQYVTYPNGTARTAQAATALAARADVASLYLIDNDASSYANATAWMKPNNSTDATKNVVGDNASLFTINGVSQLLPVLDSILELMKATPYNDVTVTDYMSKWVKLDLDSIKVLDGTTCIWSAAEGWKIETGRPTALEAPVTVTKVEAADYEAGGEDVEGNTSGDIYRLNWKVKDGNLDAMDNYRLVYTVTVDTEEEGFEYEVDYPSNGNTYLEYTDENQQPQKNDITVPEVKADEPDDVLGDSEDPDEVLGDNDSPTTGDATGLWTVLAILGVISAAVVIPARRRCAR